MKRALILTVMLASVLASCFAQTALSGTYRYSTNAYITFTGSNFTGSGSWNATTSISGTYSVSGSRLTLNITGGPRAQNTWVWTIVDANTLRDQDGDNWRKEGASAQAQTSQDFEMNGTTLVEYNGSAANVTIPAGVTAIGNWAFYECTGLTSVTIPSSVTSIGGSAFEGCTYLRNVTLSRRTRIGEDAFPSTARIAYSD